MPASVFSSKACLRFALCGCVSGFYSCSVSIAERYVKIWSWYFDVM